MFTKASGKIIKQCWSNEDKKETRRYGPKSQLHVLAATWRAKAAYHLYGSACAHLWKLNRRWGRLSDVQVDNYTGNEGGRQTLNLEPSCLCLPNPGMTGVCDHGMLAPTVSQAQDCRGTQWVLSQWRAKCLQRFHLLRRQLHNSTHRGAVGSTQNTRVSDKKTFLCGWARKEI